MSLFKKTIDAITTIANAMTTSVSGLFKAKNLEQVNIAKDLQSAIPALFDGTFDRLHDDVIHHSATLTPRLLQAVPLFAEEFQKESFDLTPHAIGRTKLEVSDKDSYGIDFVHGIVKANTLGLEYDAIRTSIVYGLRDISLWFRLSRNDSMVNETEVARIMFNYTRPGTYGFQDQLRNKPMRDLTHSNGDTSAWLVRSSFEVLASEHGPWAVSTVRSIDRRNHVCTLNNPFEREKAEPQTFASLAATRSSGVFNDYEQTAHRARPHGSFLGHGHLFPGAMPAASSTPRPVSHTFMVYVPIRFIDYGPRRIMFSAVECMAVLQIQDDLRFGKTTPERKTILHSNGRAMVIDGPREWTEFFSVFKDIALQPLAGALNASKLKYAQEGLHAAALYAGAVMQVRQENHSTAQTIINNGNFLALRVFYRGNAYDMNPDQVLWFLLVMAQRGVFDTLPTRIHPCQNIELISAESVNEFYARFIIALKASSFGHRFPPMTDIANSLKEGHEPDNWNAATLGEPAPVSQEPVKEAEKKERRTKLGSTKGVYPWWDVRSGIIRFFMFRQRCFAMTVEQCLTMCGLNDASKEHFEKYKRVPLYAQDINGETLQMSSLFSWEKFFHAFSYDFLPASKSADGRLEAFREFEAQLLNTRPVAEKSLEKVAEIVSKMGDDQWVELDCSQNTGPYLFSKENLARLHDYLSTYNPACPHTLNGNYGWLALTTAFFVQGCPTRPKTIGYTFYNATLVSIVVELLRKSESADYILTLEQILARQQVQPQAPLSPVKADEGAVGEPEKAEAPAESPMSIASLPEETELEKQLRMYREKNGSFPMAFIDQAMAYLTAKPDGFVLPVLTHTKNQYRLFTKHALFLVFGEAMVTSRKHWEKLDAELRLRLNVCELSDVNHVVGERTVVITTIRQLTNFFQSITAALRSQPDWNEAKPTIASETTAQTEAPTTHHADAAAG